MRLVQADGRVQLGLQHRVIDDVVVGQRLLDHHQVKLVELLEARRVGQRVGRVGVGHQLDAREAAADFAESLRRPSRA